MPDLPGMAGMAGIPVGGAGKAVGIAAGERPRTAPSSTGGACRAEGAAGRIEPAPAGGDIEGLIEPPPPPLPPLRVDSLIDEPQKRQNCAEPSEVP
jgi:hypothetical protein